MATILTVLSLATKRSWKDSKGEWQSQTEWHRVTCFGQFSSRNSDASIVEENDLVILRGTICYARIPSAPFSQ
jgi:single-strand DNA-binding protein